MTEELSDVEHLRRKVNRDGALWTIESATAAMPTFLRIENNRFLLPFLQDHIARAMPVTGSALFTLFIIDHRRHGFLVE